MAKYAEYGGNGSELGEAREQEYYDCNYGCESHYAADNSQALRLK